VKYVIMMSFLGGKGGLPQLNPIAFTESMTHYDVAAAKHNGKPAVPVAAGFYSMQRSRFGDWEPLIDTRRKSVSLGNLGPGPFDKDLIEDLLFANGNPINMPPMILDCPHYRAAYNRFSWKALDAEIKKNEASCKLI
jgi:hypothetical protein